MLHDACGDDLCNAETALQMPLHIDNGAKVWDGEYTGSTENGVPHGFGVFVFQTDGGGHYIGQWSNGEMHGEGGMYWQSGLSTVGMFEHNVYISGMTYLGMLSSFYADTQPDSNGYYRYIDYNSDGSVFFDGYMDENGQYKKGTVYAPDGSVYFSGAFDDDFDMTIFSRLLSK